MGKLIEDTMRAGCIGVTDPEGHLLLQRGLRKWRTRHCRDRKGHLLKTVSSLT
jgi:hypothetical protein